MRTIRLTFLVFTLATGTLVGQTPLANINGNWFGVLVIGELKLRLLLKITVAENNSLTAVMDSPDQNANNLTVDSITFQNGMLHFEMKALQIAYEGSLNKNGEIVGTFTQAGNTRPLLFRKEGTAQSNTVVKRGRVELKPCN